MKSKRRHELKHNTLDAELGKIVGFFKKRGSLIAWGALIAATIVLAGVYFYNKHTSNQERMLDDYDALVRSYVERLDLSPEENAAEEAMRMEQLQALADTDDDFWIIGMACVKYGDLCQLAALGEIPDKERQKLLDTAVGYYRRAIDKFSERAETVAIARLGLGQVYETRGKFDAAREQYETIRGMNELVGHTLISEAETFLESLEKVREPAPMAAVAPPEPEPETKPDTATQPADDTEAAGDKTEPAENEPPVPAKIDEK